MPSNYRQTLGRIYKTGSRVVFAIWRFGPALADRAFGTDSPVAVHALRNLVECDTRLQCLVHGPLRPLASPRRRTILTGRFLPCLLPTTCLVQPTPVLRRFRFSICERLIGFFYGPR